MTVTVSVAIFDGDKWAAGRPTLAEFLNQRLQSVEVYASEPNPPLAIAKACISDLGGHVISYDPIESQPGEIY